MSALEGRVAIVTGGNSGIGKETAAELAGMGAHVIVAARNPTKAAAAVQEIMRRTPSAAVEHLPLDLASFASVHAFADAFNARFDRLDVLVNNAGLTLRKRTVTEDGHETQFQVNHLSHFLLTALLHDRLAAAPAARIVNVSSTGHTFARSGLDFDDLDWERRKYRGFMVYSATKLANVLFTRELARARKTPRRSPPTRRTRAGSAPTSAARATWAPSSGSPCSRAGRSPSRAPPGPAPRCIWRAQPMWRASPASTSTSARWWRPRRRHSTTPPLRDYGM